MPGTEALNTDAHSVGRGGRDAARCYTASAHPCSCPRRDLFLIYSYSDLSGKKQARLNPSATSVARAGHSNG